MTHRPGLISVEELRTRIGSGQLDTVVLALTDMQGRLQGKRLAARYFLEEVLEHGTEGCNYLMAVDIDMNTVAGYAMSSWERGYGDFVLAPDRRAEYQPTQIPQGVRKPGVAQAVTLAATLGLGHYQAAPAQTRQMIRHVRTREP